MKGAVNFGDNGGLGNLCPRERGGVPPRTFGAVSQRVQPFSIRSNRADQGQAGDRGVMRRVVLDSFVEIRFHDGAIRLHVVSMPGAPYDGPRCLAKPALPLCPWQQTFECDCPLSGLLRLLYVPEGVERLGVQTPLPRLSNR